MEQKKHIDTNLINLKLTELSGQISDWISDILLEKGYIKTNFKNVSWKWLWINLNEIWKEIEKIEESPELWIILNHLINIIVLLKKYWIALTQFQTRLEKILRDKLHLFNRKSMKLWLREKKELYELLLKIVNTLSMIKMSPSIALFHKLNNQLTKSKSLWVLFLPEFEELLTKLWKDKNLSNIVDIIKKLENKDENELMNLVRKSTNIWNNWISISEEVLNVLHDNHK